MVIEVSHQSSLPLSVPTPTQSRPCCDSHSHEHSDVKVPTIFDAVKSGFVVTVFYYIYSDARTVRRKVNLRVQR